MSDKPFDAVITAIGGLPADAGQTPTVELGERMRTLVQARAMIDAVLTEQLTVFDARAGAQPDGQASTRAWLASQLRLGNEANLLLKVARTLPELPEASKAFAAGEITLEHAAKLAWLVGKLGGEVVAEYEQVLLSLARQAPPDQLHRACQHVFALLDPDQNEGAAARQHRQRHLTASRTIDGMLHLQGLLDAAGGDVVLAALNAAMPVPAEYEERTTDQRRADALEEICAGWLAAGAAPTSGGLPAQVQITVSLRGLRSSHRRTSSRTAPDVGDAAAAFRPTFGVPEVPFGELPGDVPVLSGGQPISIGQARRLACDAGVVPVVLGSRSEPLDVGRQSRLAPAGLRRALNLRDGGCRFPGCDRPATWCDGHHVLAWYDGGQTNLENMILVCRYHHSLIHEGWQIVGDPNGMIRFTRPDGTRLSLRSTPRCRPPTRGP